MLCVKWRDGAAFLGLLSLPYHLPQKPQLMCQWFLQSMHLREVVHSVGNGVMGKIDSDRVLLGSGASSAVVALSRRNKTPLLHRNAVTEAQVSTRVQCHRAGGDRTTQCIVGVACAVASSRSR